VEHLVADRGSVAREWFGTLPSGETIDAITLTGAGGLRMRFITFGGIITSLIVPDREGTPGDVVLGFDTLEEYRRDSAFIGALVGRYANRIANGRFTIGGREYHVAINDPPNHLHGGPNGFHRAVWGCDTFTRGTDVGANLTYVARPEDDGYPGSLNVRVTYTVTAENALVVDYRATTDAATVATFTQHSYFNLAGHDRGDILDHELTINASRFTPVDATRIPTGELRPVRGTPFDFTTPRAIGCRIDEGDEQLRIGNGYDHNFALDGDGTSLTLAARVCEPTCGRVLEVHTTEPGLQLYTGNGFDRVVGKQWRIYGRRCALALETQHFPDSPNHPAFPSTLLEPGQELRSRSIYKFSTQLPDRDV
jgi:aldose 1-epimerase